MTAEPTYSSFENVVALRTTEGLTARERQVVALIAEGRSNREIADGLYLSMNSVKTYIRSAYRKIGVTRRTQAVIWWFDSVHETTDADRVHRLARPTIVY